MGKEFDREVIRKLIQSLPWRDQQQIEQAGRKYRAIEVLDMEALWEKFKGVWKVEEPARIKAEKERLEWLEKLNRENPE